MTSTDKDCSRTVNIPMANLPDDEIQVFMKLLGPDQSGKNPSQIPFGDLFDLSFFDDPTSTPPGQKTQQP